MYYHICPNPTANKRCHGFVKRFTLDDLALADRLNVQCRSCLSLAIAGDCKRKCPNPRQNPNCKKVLGYLNQATLERAEKLGTTCKSCSLSGVSKSPEHVAKMRLSQLGRKDSEETRRKKSLRGERNGFYGRTHTADVRRRLSEKAKGRVACDEARRKMSLARRGKNNHMYGKESPVGSSKAVGGWYRGIHFRSSAELVFLTIRSEYDWASASALRIKIPYKDASGVERNYFPDFFADGTLIEVKTHGWERIPGYVTNVYAKARAAVVFCHQRDWQYVMAQVPSLEVKKIFLMRQQNEVQLDRKWERRYQGWLEKQPA